MKKLLSTHLYDFISSEDDLSDVEYNIPTTQSESSEESEPKQVRSSQSIRGRASRGQSSGCRSRGGGPGPGNTASNWKTKLFPPKTLHTLQPACLESNNEIILLTFTMNMTNKTCSL